MVSKFSQELELARIRLNALLPDLLADLLTERETKDIPLVLKWLKKVFLYNVPNGKQIRGLLIPLAVKRLSTNPSEALMKQAYILGYCLEILQASYLVADDIMDKGETRRGKPCWYKVDELGSLAVNDSLLLEHMVYRLLAKHFKGTSYYTKILDLFLGVSYKTIMGQCLDTQSGRDGNFAGFSMENYEAIVKYKTSYYTIYLPIALAATISGLDEEALLLEQVEEFAVKLGYIFQVQDDFLDCFGTEEILGKVGTDIQNGKCTWLFILAKKKCSSEQLTMILENYGRDGVHEVSVIKNLYKDLDVGYECITHLQNGIKDIHKLCEFVSNQQLSLFMKEVIQLMVFIPEINEHINVLVNKNRKGT